MSEFWRQNTNSQNCHCDHCGNEAAGRAGRSRRTNSEDAATAADDDHGPYPRENWAAHYPPAPSGAVPAMDSEGLTEPPNVVAMSAAAMQSGRGRLHGAILDDVTMQAISAAATAATVAALSQTSQRDGAALGSINCGRPIDDSGDDFAENDDLENHHEDSSALQVTRRKMTWATATPPPSPAPATAMTPAAPVWAVGEQNNSADREKHQSATT